MKKILIFEEDIVFSFILKRTLEKLGYSAVVANNEANVRNAFVDEKTFDLFLFDTGEDVANVDFLQKIRDENPTLKIIISAGFIIGLFDETLYNSGFRFNVKKYILRKNRYEHFIFSLNFLSF